MLDVNVASTAMLFLGRTERGGKKAYQRGDAWWLSLTEEDKQRFQEAQLQIAADFAKVMKAGLPPDGDEAQAIAKRQYEWVTVGWQVREPTVEAFSGLGEMYVAAPRFTKTYGAHGTGTAAFVRDAMKVYATRNLR